jgi:hypothetical protein
MLFIKKKVFQQWVPVGSPNSWNVLLSHLVYSQIWLLIKSEKEKKEIKNPNIFSASYFNHL